MKIIVKPHDIQISETDTVNEGEYNITQLNFEFSAEYTDDLVKKAIFIGNDNKAYEMVIDNNICNIPSEILVKQQSVFLGVYAYKITGSELVLRYSPSPVIFPVIDGSYKADAVPSEEITPSQFEQYQQALQNGLAEVNAKLQEVINTSETLEENGTYAKKQGDYAKETTDELISKVENGDFNGATFTPSVDAEGNISWSNDKGLDNPQTQNIKGEKGDTGEPFTISKTYPSVEAMNADFDNMEVGDYVMIASSVEDEDNAKLYVKTDTEWVFITDFSGAIGIQGEPGVGITTVTSGQSIQQDGNTVTPITVNKTDGTQQTFNVSAKNGQNGKDGVNGQNGQDGTTPNIQIGTVETLEPNEQATVTRTGTDEEPVFNFGIPKGQQGEQGIQGIPGQDGQPGADGLPGQDGADGKDATINGQNTVEITTDNNITLDQQESVLKLGLNSQLIDKQDAEGTDNTFDDGLESPLFALSGDGKSEQKTTTGKNKLDYIYLSLNEEQSTLNGGSYTYENGLLEIDATKATNNMTIRSSNISNSEFVLKAGTYYTHVCINTKKVSDDTFTQYMAGQITLAEDVYINQWFVPCPKGTKENTILMIEPGNEKTKWEPYTGGQPSPSPDYEQPINSIEGSVEFSCRGKNLLNNTLTSGTRNGITYTVNEDKSVTLNGTATTITWLILNNSITFSAGTYTMSQGNDNNNVRIFCSALDGYVENGIRTATLNKEKTSDVSINIPGGTTVSNFIIYPMIKEGSGTIEYEPYQSNQVTFNLNGEKLRSVGDVKDELVVDLDTGDYYKVENVGEVVLDGSDDENWANVPDGTGKERYTSSIIQNLVYTGTKLCQSNYFKSSTSENYYEDGTIRIAPSGGVSIYDDLFTSMDNFKQWLSTNNTIVDYILKTPTTKKLGTLLSEDLAKLKTFKGYNNVTVNTNLGLMNIRFTYGLDIKKYVDNKIAELSAQLIKGE